MSETPEGTGPEPVDEADVPTAENPIARSAGLTGPDTDQTDRPVPTDPTPDAPSADTAETDVPFADADEPLRLHYAAISDVGRVRKDNQDSGYAGPWLLSVCDGVGGAARGDIASSTAVSELRALDVEPGADPVPLLRRITDALLEAHRAIGRLVDADPSINGTSTTATIALFDGHRIGIGHVGDSRAYLFRDGELSQVTTDHTFVQSLIDEGRITEEEARVHPHRNLILKALDGVHDAEPDLFVLELVDGDRLLLCSDGACGVLDDGRMADILSMGTPDFAAVELVRASLEAGSSDNVTCVVADVVTAAAAAADPELADDEPMLVGAAAELRRRIPIGARTAGLFRGHRSGDTGELEPVDAEIPADVDFAIPGDPLDTEAMRYAPLAPPRHVWLRRVLVAAIVLGLLWIAGAGAWSWSQRQYYVGAQDGRVVLYRGVDFSIVGWDFSHVVATTDVDLDQLPQSIRDGVEDGDYQVDSRSEGETKLKELAAYVVDPTDATGDPTDDATGSTGPTDSSSPSGSTSGPTSGPTSSSTSGSESPGS